MTRPMLPASMVTALFVVAASAARAQDSKPDEAVEKARQAALTPDSAGPDFKLQGEYAGAYETDDGERRLGVQVIALGDGNFRAVGYPGGLPGAGWNEEDKTEIEGRSQEGSIVFATDKGRGVVQGGELSIQTLDGRELGVIRKVDRKSDTLGKKPPEGAVVLFDGNSAEQFRGGRLSDDGLLMQGVTSKPVFQDFTLHLEFMLSFMPHARGQARANSGCYMQGRYEVQILDSFGLECKHNECGGIYEIADPAVNMCFPPLAWQTYDVDFTAARFDGSGRKLQNARVTVHHNGVLIHKDVELPRATRAAPVEEGPQPGPIYIQDHGNPLRFRNIWVAEKQ